jgi:hypothetical protein
MRRLWVGALLLAACAHDLHDRTVGILGMRGGLADAVDLSITPHHAYAIICTSSGTWGCPPFQSGRTYHAHFQTTAPNANMTSIEYQGKRIPTSVTVFACEDPTQHWEHDDKDGAVCKPGKDPISWQRDKSSDAAGSRYANAPACQDQASLAGQSLSVVIRVSPVAGKAWTFDEGANILAGKLLTAVNTGGLEISEANGVAPNLIFDVTIDQSMAGTEQDAAWVDVKNGSGTLLFHETTGSAAFTSMDATLGALGARIAGWLVNGWHAKGPCRQDDGSMRLPTK